MRLPTADPHVICCGVAGGAVLLSTEQEVYYGLNTVGAYVWEHLPPVCQTVEQLSAALSALHPDVPVEEIGRASCRERVEVSGGAVSLQKKIGRHDRRAADTPPQHRNFQARHGLPRIHALTHARH